MFRQILRNFSGSAWSTITGRSLWWHTVAILITFVIVTTGLDWTFYEATRSTIFHPIVWAAGIGGFLLPVVVPLGMYIAGAINRNGPLRHKAMAVASAVILASVLAIMYKIFTGRLPPEFITSIGTTDISHRFDFGFLRNGIFWGWPSSHTAVAVAGGVTIFRLFKNTPVRVLSVLYMGIVAVGVAVGFHWLSDVAAGAIFGTLIGNIVAREYHSHS
ncbi:MAG: hypothetical protein JWM46_356 [Candidatus Kaiserbacteria bacterium]|nr:hypothetical protein [Candidatus Kaiserbacteria bacterium]